MFIIKPPLNDPDLSLPAQFLPKFACLSQLTVTLYSTGEKTIQMDELTQEKIHASDAEIYVFMPCHMCHDGV